MEERGLYFVDSDLPGTIHSLYSLATWKNGAAFKNVITSPTGKPIIKIAELNNGISGNTVHTNQIFSEEISLHAGDLVFAWSGNPDTSIDIYRYNLPDGWLNQHIFKITVKEDIVNKDFFYYLMKYLRPNFKKIASNKQTTGLGHVTISDLKALEVKIPDLSTQERISQILKCLDDKVIINKKLSKNLENQAQLVFKNFYIDFGKAETFEDTDLGMIPSGWKVGVFEDIIDSTISGDWGNDSPTGNYTHKVACIRGCDFQDVKFGLRGKTPERYILEKNYQSKKFRDQDLLVEISGGTATIATGRVCPISQKMIENYEGDVVCTNFCRIVRPKEGYGAFAYYYWLYKYNTNVMFAYENGTSGIKNFSIRDFISKEPIVIPPADALSSFQRMASTMHKEIQNIGSESQTICNIRDILLPRLMSGEIAL